MTMPSLEKAQQIFEQICLQTDKLDLSLGKKPEISRNHFLAVARCAQTIASHTQSLNPQKAYILGLLHDCGQPAENRDKNKFHGLVGYEKMLKLGLDETARICLTHSFPEYDFKPERFTYAFPAMVRCRQLIDELIYDDYDKLIQYSDMLCRGDVITDLKSRILYIVEAYKIKPKDARVRYRTMLKIKRYFDTLCQCDTYKLLGIKNA